VTHIATLSGGGSSGPLIDLRKFDSPASQIVQAGVVTDYDTFGEGLSGFAPHFHNDTVTCPPSTTGRFPYVGAGALMLSTTEEPAARGTEFRAASAYKRLGWVPGSRGIVQLRTMFSLSGTASMTTFDYPFESAWMGLDFQAPDDTARAFGMVALRADPTNNGIPAWFLRTGRTSTTGGWRTPDYVKIPGTEGWFSGFNEGKRGYQLARLAVNTEAIFTGGDYYLEFQWADRLANLRGLAPGVPWDLLLNAGSDDHFRNGANKGYGIAAKPDKKARMLIGASMTTVGDVLR
jgi:hypothetical protein